MSWWEILGGRGSFHQEQARGDSFRQRVRKTLFATGGGLELRVHLGVYDGGPVGQDPGCESPMGMDAM